jgi:membrane-bound lytic murein transglycosylase D
MFFSCAHRSGVQPQEETTSGSQVQTQVEEKDITDLLEEDVPVATENLTGEPKFDIPIIINEKVEYFINYFQTTRREIFTKWLSRSRAYIPMMKKIFKEKGLPEDLVYMALIESGFSPHAYSRARACGPWQFIKSTGRRYGLKVNDWVDERRDPEKSTIAAAEYLDDLYDMFGHWYLAAAAYNAGERKVLKAMQRSNNDDFWKLAETRYLKRETKDYVPKMIAGALIAKYPELYGFTDVEYLEPVEYAKISLNGAYDLKVISRECGIEYETLRALNPELRTNFTPPHDVYELKVPLAQYESCSLAISSISPEERYKFSIHTVKKGETLSLIAKKYNSSVNLIKEVNRIRNSKQLKVGMRLIIPEIYRSAKRQNNKQLTGEENSSIVKVRYIVKSGDTLYGLAKKYGVSVGDIKLWNNLDGEPIKPGDVLIIKTKSVQ